MFRCLFPTLARVPHKAAPAAIILAWLACLTGCNTGQTTRFVLEDFNDMTSEMANSLRAGEAMRNRSAASPLWVISIDKATNLTSDLMSKGEKWYVIAKVRSSLPLLALRNERNIRFVIPAERKQAMLNDPNIGVKAGELTETFAVDRRPTHTMTAVFRSLTRAVATERIDVYMCEFEILDLATGVPVWTDKFEFKRKAHGHIWD